MQRERRTNPIPIGAETAAAAVVAYLLAALWGVHVGRGIANWLAGAGFQTPSVTDSIVSVIAVLGGDPRAGLRPPPAAGQGAGGTSLMFWVVATQLLLAVAVALLVRLWWRRWGPGRVLGMASVEEAENVLGLSRLRRSAPIVRPDLYGKKARHED